MKLDSVIRCKNDIESVGDVIENKIIETIDVNVIGHFGNAVSLEIFCKSVAPMSGHSNTQNIGYIIRAIIELLDLSGDNGIRLSEIKNIPCRVVYDRQYRCIGIGHFMKDRFVYIKDLLKIDEQ